MNLSIEQQLSAEGFYVSTTSGVSMRPMLRDRRDRVVIRAVGNERLSKWDLPLYRAKDGRYLLHRIIGIAKDGSYIIRGDNTYRKEYVTQEQILGVVTEFYRGNKHISADHRAYRRYAAVWNALYPIRKICHLPLFWLKRLKRNHQASNQGVSEYDSES